VIRYWWHLTLIWPWELKLMGAHGVCAPWNMGVDHGERGDKCPQKLEWGDANEACPFRQILSYRYKKERFVAFKIRHIRFRLELCPGPSWRSSRDSPRHLSRLGRDIPPHTLLHSTPTHLRRSPCIPQNSSHICAYTLRTQFSWTLKPIFHRQQPTCDWPHMTALLLLASSLAALRGK